ncbi:MAG: hypothetical protein J0M15_06645 [Deltaproteobacteria bacterium]|nr:hypothetical protein [Deltaproteobacteria bacterium]
MIKKINFLVSAMVMSASLAYANSQFCLKHYHPKFLPELIPSESKSSSIIPEKRSVRSNEVQIIHDGKSQ